MTIAKGVEKNVFILKYFLFNQNCCQKAPFCSEVLHHPSEKHFFSSYFHFELRGIYYTPQFDTMNAQITPVFSKPSYVASWSIICYSLILGKPKNSKDNYPAQRSIKIQKENTYNFYLVNLSNYSILGKDNPGISTMFQNGQ